MAGPLFRHTEQRLRLPKRGVALQRSTKLLRGFPAAGHFGILGMRERMEQIRDSLELTSSPGKGADVTAHLPLGRAMV